MISKSVNRTYLVLGIAPFALAACLACARQAVPASGPESAQGAEFVVADGVASIRGNTAKVVYDAMGKFGDEVVDGGDATRTLKAPLTCRKSQLKPESPEDTPTPDECQSGADELEPEAAARITKLLEELNELDDRLVWNESEMSKTYFELPNLECSLQTPAAYTCTAREIREPVR